MSVQLREKSSQSGRIHFVALRDEKKRDVCLISSKEEK
jgi:hypothetical protein